MSAAAIPDPPDAELVAPGAGRVFSSTRIVRLSDVDPEGLVRLDAIARYLQDVATDDVRDAGVEDAVAWVVRRTTIAIGRRPLYGESLKLATWCSGTGSALAERRTSIVGEGGAHVETVSLWVSLDRRTLRPAPLEGPHFDPYREAASDRRVKARFVVPGPPEGLGGSRPWPLRRSDIDLFHHVNNVVAWTATEEEALRSAPATAISWGQVEYRRAIEADETPTISGITGDGQAAVWLLGADGVPSVAARFGWCTDHGAAGSA